MDTIWLGMRVRGTGEQYGATRASQVYLSGVDLQGSGDVVSYLTEAFGNPEFYINSTDGFDASSGYRDDTATLPPDAHTHMSWAFTEPGVYRLTMQATLAPAPDAGPVSFGEQTFTFAVGVDPHSVSGMAGATVLDHGHADVTVDMDTGELYLFADPHGGGAAGQEIHDPNDTVIEVPNKALHALPGDPAYRFLGRAGGQVYQLPQAVLGRHVHGEIDPHLWQDVGNAIAYVKLIRDTLIDADPANGRLRSAGPRSGRDGHRPGCRDRGPVRQRLRKPLGKDPVAGLASASATGPVYHVSVRVLDDDECVQLMFRPRVRSSSTGATSWS